MDLTVFIFKGFLLDLDTIQCHHYIQIILFFPKPNLNFFDYNKFKIIYYLLLFKIQ